MIRLANEKDREKLLNFLYKEAEYNIFIIGDIETFGFDKDFQRVYLEINETGEYLSVFLRYKQNAIYYSPIPRFNIEFLEIFKNDQFEFISGKFELMELIAPYLKDFKEQKMYFCHASKIESSITYENSIIKKLSTEEECGKLYDLLKIIEEFSFVRQSREDFIQNKMHSLEMGVVLYISEDNKIVSTVSTTAETTKNAMVVGVATDPDYRKKGYATILLLELMKYYFEVKNKNLCLFYDNPEAGKIYLKLGFKYMGAWNMYKLIDPKRKPNFI